MHHPSLAYVSFVTLQKKKNNVCVFTNILLFCIPSPHITIFPPDAIVSVGGSIEIQSSAMVIESNPDQT